MGGWGVGWQGGGGSGCVCRMVVESALAEHWPENKIISCPTGPGSEVLWACGRNLILSQASARPLIGRLCNYKDALSAVVGGQYQCFKCVFNILK